MTGIIYHMTEIANAKQKALVKTQKASKIIAWLLVFGGGSLVGIGLAFQVLTSTGYGILLMVCSLPLFVLSSYANRKLREFGR